MRRLSPLHRFISVAAAAAASAVASFGTILLGSSSSVGRVDAFFVPLPLPVWTPTRATALVTASGRFQRRRREQRLLPLRAKATTFQQQGEQEEDRLDEEDEKEIQWQLFQQHHAKTYGSPSSSTSSTSSWKGIWTTYDYIGDVMDETVASVDFQSILASEQPDLMMIQQSHSIVVGAKRSDCATCFDSMDIKTIPVAQYTRDNLSRVLRCASCGMVIGPKLMRTGKSSLAGSVATELVLSFGDGRVRVVFYHAPVWQRDSEPGVGPPQGLKLFRCLVSREALREAPPTLETETLQQNGKNSNDDMLLNPIFYRPVPPFDWHKRWGDGTSWTWGPRAGNQGWSIPEMDTENDDNDAATGEGWHGSAPVECWNLRLPGGIFIQAPRVIPAGTMNTAADPMDAAAAATGTVGICRLAWLPVPERLLRIEAGILALQPIVNDDDDDDDDDDVITFAPPSLASLRCDSLMKLGDLPGQPQFAKEEQDESNDRAIAAAAADADKNESSPSPARKAAQVAVEAAAKAAAAASLKESSSSSSSSSQQSSPKHAVAATTLKSKSDNGVAPSVQDLLDSLDL